MKYRTHLLALLLAWVSISAQATTASTTATITVFSSITFAPAFLSFGTQLIGSTAAQVLTVTNGGVGAFSPTVSLTGTNAPTAQFSFSSQCNGALAVNASCQISVTFSPTAAESDSAMITVAGSGRTYTAAISGTGSNAPVAPVPVSIALSPPSINIFDNATGGSIVSRATVTCSDGTTTCPYTLSTSDTHYYQISGNNIVLAHGLSPADDGPHNTVISTGP
jgi:Abnormal spindle-like microcephaly-assoc'd, ASPM-SPD-2-Hydin